MLIVFPGLYKNLIPISSTSAPLHSMQWLKAWTGGSVRLGNIYRIWNLRLLEWEKHVFLRYKTFAHIHTSWTPSVKEASRLLTLVHQLVSDTRYELFSVKLWELLMRDWNIHSLLYGVESAVLESRKCTAFSPPQTGETRIFRKDLSRTPPAQRQTTKRAFWGSNKNTTAFSHSFIKTSLWMFNR